MVQGRSSSVTDVRCSVVLIPLVVSLQVLKHKSVEHVDHVDLDEDVVKTCEQYFPQWGDAWKDHRALLHICDGAQFVRDAADGTYDVIIQDSSDPFVVGDDGVMKPLPSEALYEKSHICQLHRILKPNGILNIQVRWKICLQAQSTLSWSV
jgi:spermidine synthase